MGKIAFVFPGQGAQFSGMGKDLYENDAAAREIFDFAGQYFSRIKELCFYGTEEELKDTKNTQAAVFTVSLACAHALGQRGVKPSAAAGFSLGEMTAAAFSNMFKLGDAFEAVLKRSKLMSENQKGCMAAVLRLSDEVAEELAGRFSEIFPVNYNCDGQLVFAGDEGQMKEFISLVSQNKGRAMPLAVSGAFHSPYMNEASGNFLSYLENINIAPPVIPVYSNYTAMPYGENARELLAKQMCNPVLWKKTIQNMIAGGFDTFVELGPGKVLSGLIKKIDSTVSVFNVSGCKSLNLTAEALSGRKHDEN